MSGVAIKSKIDYNVLPIVVDDIDTVMEFLFKLFFWDEPLNASLGLMKEKHIDGDLKNYSLNLLNNGELNFFF